MGLHQLLGVSAGPKNIRFHYSLKESSFLLVSYGTSGQAYCLHLIESNCLLRNTKYQDQQWSDKNDAWY